MVNEDLKSATDWGIVSAIFILIPLFAIKLAQTAYPIPNCASADFEKNARLAETCNLDRRTQMDKQYMFSLFIGFFFVILGYVMFYLKLATRSPARGAVYGGLATLVYAVYANYNRLENQAQTAIIGLVLVSMLFLPTLTRQSLIV